jgi:hypothetical protein
MPTAIGSAKVHPWPEMSDELIGDRDCRDPVKGASAIEPLGNHECELAKLLVLSQADDRGMFTLRWPLELQLVLSVNALGPLDARRLPFSSKTEHVN